MSGLLFGVLSLVAGISSLCLPETRNIPLAQTIEQGEELAANVAFGDLWFVVSRLGCPTSLCVHAKLLTERFARLIPLNVEGKGSPYSIAERRVPELIPVLGSQPAGDVSHKLGGRLPLLSARPAVTPVTLKRAATNFAAW